MTSNAIGSLFVSLGLDTAAFTAGMKQAQGSMGAFAAKLRTAGTAMTAGITVPLTALAVGAQAAARSLGELDNQARVAGMAAQDFKVLALAADQFGIGQEKVADIMKDVSDKVGDFLQTGAGPMADFFENIGPKVGVTAEQFKKLNSRDALALYVSSLEKANLSQAEMTFYMEALASDATALLPVFSDNAKALKAMDAEATRLGLNLNGDLIASAKATEAQFRITKDVLGIQFQQALVQLAPAVSQLMGAIIPLVTKLAGWVTELATAFSALSPQTQAFIAGAIGVAAAMGPVLIGVGMMIPAISALAAGFLALVSPIGLVVAAVALVAGGAYLLYQNWDGVVAYFAALWASVKQSASDAWENLKQGFLNLHIQAALGLIELATSVRDGMARLAADMVGWAGNIIDGFVQGFKAKIATARDSVTGFAGNVAGWFKDSLGIRSPSRIFAGFGDNVVQGLVVGIDRSGSAAVKAIDDLAARMKTAGQSAVDGMLSTFAKGLAKGDMAGAFKGAVAGYMSSAQTAFGDVLTSAFSKGGGGFASIGSTITGAFKGIGAAFSGGGGFMAGISGALSSALPLVGMATSLAGLIKGFSSQKTVGAGLDLNVRGGNVSGREYETIQKSSFWGLINNTSTEFSALSKSLARMLNKQLDTVQGTVQDVYKRAGISVTDAMVDGFKFDMGKIKTFGKTKEEIAAQIQKQFENYQNALSKSIGGVSLKAAALFADVSDVLNMAGQKLDGTFKRMAIAAGQLADAFGGVQNMSNLVGSFVQTFFTEAEQVALAQKDLGAVFSDLGLAIPQTMEQFKALVLSQNLMTKAGRENYAALLAAADTFAFVTQAAGNAGAAMQSVNDAFAAMDGRYLTEFDARLARAGQANGSIVSAAVSGAGAVGNVALTASRDGVAVLKKIYDVLVETQGQTAGNRI